MAWTDAARAAAKAARQRSKAPKGLTAPKKVRVGASISAAVKTPKGTYSVSRALNKIHQGPNFGAPMTTYARNRLLNGGG